MLRVNVAVATETATRQERGLENSAAGRALFETGNGQALAAASAFPFALQVPPDAACAYGLQGSTMCALTCVF